MTAKVANVQDVQPSANFLFNSSEQKTEDKSVTEPKPLGNREIIGQQPYRLIVSKLIQFFCIAANTSLLRWERRIAYDS